MFDSAAQMQREGEKDDGLREWLLNQKIPSSVCDALELENVTKREIMTYSEQDLIDLCNHLNLNIVIKKRFINSIKSIPNAVSSISQNKSIIKVFLGNQEKQQMEQFKIMTETLKKNINTATNELKECDNDIDNMKNEINKVYDDIQTMVEQARTQDLNKVELTKRRVT